MTSSALAAGKTATGSLDYNMAAALCYLPIAGIQLIASILFLATEPKESKLVRFHAFQSLLLSATVVALGVVLIVLSVVLPIVGGAIDEMLMLVASLVTLLLTLAYAAGVLGAYVLGLYQAYSGNVFRIPVIGQIADRLSG